MHVGKKPKVDLLRTKSHSAFELPLIRSIGSVSFQSSLWIDECNVWEGVASGVMKDAKLRRVWTNFESRRGGTFFFISLLSFIYIYVRGTRWNRIPNLIVQVSLGLEPYKKHAWLDSTWYLNDILLEGSSWIRSRIFFFYEETLFFVFFISRRKLK